MDFELELVEPQEIVLQLDNIIYLGADPNIIQMQTADLVEITKNGGTLATDEEYAVAENEFQKLARIIMGVVRI